MALLQRLLTSLLAGLALLLIQRVLQRRGFPKLPLQLGLLALLGWAVLPLVRGWDLPSSYRPWLAVLDQLLLTLAGLRLGLWLSLEMPAGLGWWKRPPDLLLQLMMIGAGTVITVVVVRESARFDLVGLVTTSAVLTAVLGLAAQETLKDLFAGLELQLGDDFSVGDWLDLGGDVQGVVESITWRDTMLRNLDGCRLIVPNGKITAEVITNRSASGAASNRFEVGLDYSFPPAQARALLEGVLQHHPRVLTAPPPRVRVKDFGESAITYELQVWQREMTLKAVLELRSELLEQIWYALQRAGQSIPFPVRELHPRRRNTPDAMEQPSTAHAPEQAQSALFAVLTVEQRQRLTAAGRPLRFGPGEAIVREGEDGDCLYQLLQGRVEVLKAVGTEHPVVVQQLGPGEIFGEMTLLLDAPRSATVRALEECQLLQLNRAAVTPLLQEHPQLLQHLADQVNRRRQQLDQLDQERHQAADTSLLGTMRRLFRVVRGSSSAGA